MANTTTVRRGLSRLLAVAVAASTVALGLALLPVPAARAATTTTFAQDTSLYLSGPGITLTIDSGSEADSVTVTSTTVAIVVSIGSSFTLRYPDPAGNLANDGSLSSCSFTAGDNVITFAGPQTVTFTPSATPACVGGSSGGGGGGGGGGSAAYAYFLGGPTAGATYLAGDTVNLSWGAGGSGVVKSRLSLSTDNGSTWSVVADNQGPTATFTWSVPNVTTSTAKLKLEALGSSGSSIASGLSSVFSITGTAIETVDGEELVVPPVEETPATPDPGSDPNVMGGYSPQSALNATRSINSDLGLTTADAPADVYCVPGSLIKTDQSSAVYYCGADGKRYTFPNERIFYSWFDNFDGLITILPETMARITLGGNVMYRPGRRMIKIESDPKVYAVTRGGILRWVSTELVAETIYGANWNQMIDDISVAFFFSYTIGEPITEADLGL